MHSPRWSREPFSCQKWIILFLKQCLVLVSTTLSLRGSAGDELFPFPFPHQSVRVACAGARVLDRDRDRELESEPPRGNSPGPRQQQCLFLFSNQAGATAWEARGGHLGCVRTAITRPDFQPVPGQHKLQLLIT